MSHTLRKKMILLRVYNRINCIARHTINVYYYNSMLPIYECFKIIAHIQ